MSCTQSNFINFSNEEKLAKIFEHRLRGSSTRGRDGISATNLSELQISELISSVSSSLSGDSFKFSPYREVLKLKNANQNPRIISIPTLRDRLVLAALSEFLRTEIPSIRFPTPQSRISDLKAMLNSGKYRDFLRLDIMAFYPSIEHSSVVNSLTEHGIAPDAVRLIVRACENPTLAAGFRTSATTGVTRGVPAGTALANVLGELVLQGLDSKINSISNVSYLRYVDDIVVLSPYGMRGKVRSEIVTGLRSLGLRAHPKKTREKSASGLVSKDAFDFLGYTFVNKGITIHKSRHFVLIDNLARPITMLRRAIVEQRADIDAVRNKAEWWLNFRITGCISGGVRRGWLPYYSQIDNLSVLHHLDDVVRKLVSRLPSGQRVEPKSFLRSYTLIRDPRRDRDKYIVNFDEISDLKEMKRILQVASDYSVAHDSETVKKQFNRFVGSAIRELETDIGIVS